MALPRACGSPWRIWLQIGNGESLCRSGSPSPTHVGMDRSHHQKGHRSRPKPHARGDGPVPASCHGCTPPQAPRTWGWTGGPPTPRTHSVPSPTHVGVDRVLRGPGPRHDPKPHARGDGPTSSAPREQWPLQAPRTWGWTAGLRGSHQPRKPSPTHVGMDRVLHPARPGTGPKPHARGDGPTWRVWLAGARAQAPRTWGWTVTQPLRSPQSHPSPTHVGMDRGSCGGWSAPRPKPHARGDGPNDSDHRGVLSDQAPRTWGWTAHDGGRAGIDMPSPTHVGMDRLMEQTGAPSLAKPHARGDGPLFECGPGLA